MKLWIRAATILAGALAFAAPLLAADDCVDCHQKETPNIVSDWKLSRHSSQDVTCSACHGAEHRSAADVAKVAIPTPETCAACHDTQVQQFKRGKHAAAWAAMQAMPTIHAQPVAMTEGMKGCGGCHKIGLKTPLEIEDLRASGSVFGTASCDACHTRHTFSKAEARRAAGLPDLSHGLRSSAVGDVLGVEARRPACAQADRHAARGHGGAHLPDVSHAGREPRGADGLGFPRRAAPAPGRQAVGRRSHRDPPGPRRARPRRAADRAPRGGEGGRCRPAHRGGLAEGAIEDDRRLRSVATRRTSRRRSSRRAIR